ncbi:MAG: MFS transporter [Egibacteraceae bacterium]
MIRSQSWRLGIVAERDFGLLWLGRTLSLVGDYAFRVALITYLVSATGSAWSVAAAGAALLVPALVFYLFGGVSGDRAASRRRMMIGADLLRFAAVAAIAVAILQNASPALVVALALLIGVGDGFFQPVSFALLTEIVPKHRLVAANSANSIGQQFALIGGPLLGSLLVDTLGPSVAFGFDAATFLLSGLCILGIRQPARREVTPVGESTGARQVLAEISSGLRYVLTQRWLVLSFAVGAVANAVFTGNLDVTVPFILSPSGVGEAADLGWFYALEGVGALLGAVLLLRVARTNVGAPMFGMLALMASSLALVGYFGNNPGTYVMAIVYGVGLHFFNSLFPALLQEKVPDALMSRVGSLVFLAFNGLMPLGTLVMGPLIGLLAPAGTVLLSASVVAVVCLLAAFTPSIRALHLTAPPA